jgi:hypothetical protein
MSSSAKIHDISTNISKFIHYLSNMKAIKNILIFCLFIPFTANILAQSDSNFVWSYELEDDAWQNWDTINRAWMKEVYFPCLKENKLIMSCANCVNIYIDARLSIDSCGNLIDLRILKENICSKTANEKLKQCFFNYFRNLVFPLSLRNKKIIAKFGTGLKC